MLLVERDVVESSAGVRKGLHDREPRPVEEVTGARGGLVKVGIVVRHRSIDFVLVVDRVVEETRGGAEDEGAEAVRASVLGVDRYIKAETGDQVSQPDRRVKPTETLTSWDPSRLNEWRSLRERGQDLRSSCEGTP